MAVKVIKIKPPRSVTKKRVCKNCGATLAYTPDDVKEYHGTDYGGGPDGEEWITCPNCNKKVVIRSW